MVTIGEAVTSEFVWRAGRPPDSRRDAGATQNQSSVAGKHRWFSVSGARLSVYGLVFENTSRRSSDLRKQLDVCAAWRINPTLERLATDYGMLLRILERSGALERMSSRAVKEKEVDEEHQN